MNHKGIRDEKTEKRKMRIFSGIRKGLTLLGRCLVKFSCLAIGLVVISLLFVYLYGCLIKSPYLRLDRIVITGLDEELKAEIQETCGLQGTLSLLDLNLNTLKENIEKHPWVRRVELEKRFPHTLIIRADREQTWALVAADGLYCLNPWGEIFASAEDLGDLDYPVITGVDTEENGGEEQLQRAVEVLKTFEKQEAPWSLNELSEVHVKKNGTMSLYFVSLPLAIQVQGGELAGRVDNLKRLVEHLKSTGRIHMVRGINLNYRDAAVVSMKKG